MCDEGGDLYRSHPTVLQDDGLSPVEKLEKYADSENIFNRQMVARTVLETLRQVLEERGPAHGDREEVGAEVGRVFRVVELLARDTEPSVRAELMEQVIWLSSLFSNLNLRNIVFQHISPATGAPHSDVLPGAGDPAAALLADGGGAHAPPAAGRQVSRHRGDAILGIVWSRSSSQVPDRHQQSSAEDVAGSAPCVAGTGFGGYS